MASPGFDARRGKTGDFVMGHSRRAVGPGAGDCSVTNSFVTNAVLMERAASC